MKDATITKTQARSIWDQASRGGDYPSDAERYAAEGGGRAYLWEQNRIALVDLLATGATAIPVNLLQHAIEWCHDIATCDDSTVVSGARRAAARRARATLEVAARVEVGDTMDRRREGGFLWVCIEEDMDLVMENPAKGWVEENLIESGERTWHARSDGYVFEVRRWDGDMSDEGSRWWVGVFGPRPCDLDRIGGAGQGRWPGLEAALTACETEFGIRDEEGVLTEEYLNRPFAYNESRPRVKVTPAVTVEK